MKITKDPTNTLKGIVKNPRLGGMASSPKGNRKGKPNPLITMRFKVPGLGK